MANGIIVQGDQFPVLEGHIVDSAGNAVDLTGVTGVTVRFVKPDGTPVSAAATITNAPLGIVQYAWQPTDTDTPGLMPIVFIVNRGGAMQTYPGAGPLTIQVNPHL